MYQHTVFITTHYPHHPPPLHTHTQETGVGLTRALIAVLQHNAHVINMSYGEATTTPNHGRFVQLASELVHKHGVVFVSSAGNAGPALSTVGAPGGSAGCILGIGAYVSPDMAAVAHAVRCDGGGGGAGGGGGRMCVLDACGFVFVV